MGKHTTIFLAAGILAASLTAFPRAASATANVSILYTGDTHGHLQSFYYDSEKLVGGVAKRAIFLQEKRRHKKMIWLTLDSGDAISGTPLSDLFQGYLDIEAMNRLGYDAMALGVHEFDYGQAVLRQRMTEAKFPILSANVIENATGQPFAKPYVVLERGGIKMAVFGLTTAEVSRRVAPENFAGLSVQDPIETARSLVPQLRTMAEIVICVSHLGVNEDIHLAGQVPGIDVVCGGMSHSELTVPMKVGQTLVVHDGHFGRNVGLLKLSFNRDADGSLKRVWFDSSIEPMSGKWVENTQYLEWLASYKAQMSERLGTIVGSAAGRLGMAKAKSSETELGNYVCDILREKTNSDIALLPASFFKAPLPEGAITLGDLYNSLPYDHYGMVLNVTGGELQEILNDSANQIGKGGFPQVSGLSMSLFNAKAYNIQVNGRPLDPFSRYTLASSDQLADAAYAYATLGTITDRRYTGKLIREFVRESLGSGVAAQSGLYQRIMFLAQEPLGAAPASPASGEAEETIAPEPEPEEPAALGGEQSGFIPDEAPAGSAEDEIVRHDRSGNPIDEPVRIEDEIISEDSSPPASEPGPEVLETPPVLEEEPVAEDFIGEMEIGRQEQSQGDLAYVFYVAKVDNGYELHLQVSNIGTGPVDLRYASGEMWDFGVFDGQSLLWNFNMNRSFMQAMKVDLLAPGEARDFHAAWNGRSNDDVLVPPGSYRFQATHTLMDSPLRIEFTAGL